MPVLRTATSRISTIAEFISFAPIDHLAAWLVLLSAGGLHGLDASFRTCRRGFAAPFKTLEGPAMKSAITGKDPLMGFRASPTMRASVVRWAESQSDNPSLSEAIRRLVELGLTVKARPKQSAPARAERAKDLAAKVIDSFPADTTNLEETASRKRRPLKGPEEFRDLRADRAKK
jgi:hypothetical protein